MAGRHTAGGRRPAAPPLPLARAGTRRTRNAAPQCPAARRRRRPFPACSAARRPSRQRAASGSPGPGAPVPSSGGRMALKRIQKVRAPLALWLPASPKRRSAGGGAAAATRTAAEAAQSTVTPAREGGGSAARAALKGHGPARGAGRRHVGLASRGAGRGGTSRLPPTSRRPPPHPPPSTCGEPRALGTSAPVRVQPGRRDGPGWRRKEGTAFWGVGGSGGLGRGVDLKLGPKY